MSKTDDKFAGVVAIVGGVIEAMIIIYAIADFGMFLDWGAFGFLAIPGAAVVAGIYLIRAASPEADQSCLFLGVFWLLLGSNLPAFVYFLFSKGWSAP